MNQKKCPKCGESNPVEGVMCWACYTPLSGGTSAGAKPGVAAIAAPPHAEEKEKPKITPVQMGVLGVGLLVVLGMGFKSLSGGPSPDVDVSLPSTPGSPPTGPPVVVPSRPTSPSAPTTIAPQASIPIPTGVGDPMAYIVTTPPRPGVSWATVGIVPSVANMDGITAGRMASLAHRPFARSRRYQGIYVYVFADKQTAALFQQYQLSRRGAPLGPNDYEDQALQPVWPKTLARYEYFQGKEAVRYPANSPNEWYRGDSDWKAAR